MNGRDFKAEIAMLIVAISLLIFAFIHGPVLSWEHYFEQPLALTRGDAAMVILILLLQWLYVVIKKGRI